jgi:hypothetical protein
VTQGTASKYATEVAHDTKLLELLHELAMADFTMGNAGESVLSSAAKAHSSSYHDLSLTVDDGDFPKTSRVESIEGIPEGTIIHQAKTWTRGEAGYYVRDASAFRGRRRASVADAVEVIEADPHASKYALKNLVSYMNVKEAVLAAHKAIIEHEKDYTGWNRYFLVVSSSGHVHRSMHCSTCYPSTGYAPVVSLSGHSEDEAIEVLGEHMCSVCFPDAPVNGKPKKLTKAAAKKLIEAEK